MTTFSEIVSSILGRGFDATALEVFRHQAANCEPYGRYLSLLGVAPQGVDSVQGIPFMPIELFRGHRVYCGGSGGVEGEGEPELEFSSSGTTGVETSTHYVASAELYTQSFRSGFREFFGDLGQYRLQTLLPSYREGSSLLYMIEDFRGLMQGDRLIVWGVTFALLEAARTGSLGTLPSDTIIIETGGMKGRGQEISRPELYKELRRGFGVERIYSEYGMCELLSQAYSLEPGVFKPSSTMRVVGRRLDNPLLPEETGKLCGINIIDLCNYHSCSFLATGDRGVVHSDGSFEIHGRIEGEILRGCNML